VAHGVRAFTLCLQGGMPGYEGSVNSAFRPDGTLQESYLARVRRVIEACDRHGAAVILGCFYQRQDQIMRDEAAVKAGVVNAANWIRSSGFTNVLLEIANEFPHGGFDHRILKSPEGEAELIRLAKQAAPELLVSTSGIGAGRLANVVAEACDFLLIHFTGVKLDDIPARIAACTKFHKPIVCNEDDKLGEQAARAAELSVTSGASWGLMLEKHNQHFPFTFQGAADDPVVYAKLRQLTAPFPGKTWRTGTPAEFGMDAGRLQAFREFVGGRGCVVRHGTMIFTWGDPAQRGDVASACKPVYAHFLAKAVEDRTIESFDQPVRKWEPPLEPLNSGLDFKDRRITWRHLINQTSCYGVREKPGEAFDYSDFNMALLFDTLFLKVYGTTYDKVDAEVLRPGLTDLLECEDEPTFMAFGAGNRPGRLAMSVRDMARFGLLYLHRGHCKKRALLSEPLATQLVTSSLAADLPRTKGEKAEMLSAQRLIGGGNNQTDHFGSYSFAWWTNGKDREGKRHWTAAPLDAFAALGHGGQRALVVIPSLDLIVSWNDAKVDGREQQNRALELLRGAVVEDAGDSSASP
ncbi:MAG: serine hydrolase, partial [Deltaproteobacteria bacterium]